ncbi:MAG: SURF1 family protein [Burkholderiaceae bacterium]
MTGAATTGRNSRRFVWLTAATLLGLALTFSLGRWQLSRATQKEQIHSAIEAQKQRPALDAAGLLQQMPSDQSLAPLYHRSVKLQGSWLPQHTIFLDNRQMQGRPGFFVLTPLALAGSNHTVVVQRGWVARNFTERAQVPQVPTPEGSVVVYGRLAGPPPKLWEFESSHITAGPAHIRQNIDLPLYSLEIKRPLLMASVLELPADAVAGDGLQRDWLQVGTGTAKHYAYAAQWFALSALLALLYVWFQMLKPLLQRRSIKPIEKQDRYD